MRRILGPAAGAAIVALLVLAPFEPAVAAQPDSTTEPGSETTEPAETTAPPDTAPETTTAETTAPGEDTATTTAPADDGDGDDGDDFPWGVLIAVVIIAIILAAIATALFGRSRRSGQAPVAGTTGVRNVLGTAEWVHDQASIELMAGAGLSPERLRVGWEDTRRRMIDLSGECGALAVGTDRATGLDLQRLGQALDGLTGALDTNVALRLRAATDPSTAEALRASNAAVDARRSDLGTAIAGVRRHL